MSEQPVATSASVANLLKRCGHSYLKSDVSFARYAACGKLNRQPEPGHVTIFILVPFETRFVGPGRCDA